MGKKKVISITISEDVLRKLEFLGSKSRTVNEILEKLFDGIGEREILEMIKLKQEGKSVADYLLKRYFLSKSVLKEDTGDSAG